MWRIRSWRVETNVQYSEDSNATIRFAIGGRLANLQPYLLIFIGQRKYSSCCWSYKPTFHDLLKSASSLVYLPVPEKKH